MWHVIDWSFVRLEFNGTQHNAVQYNTKEQAFIVILQRHKW